MIRLDLKNLPIGFAYFFVRISLFFVLFCFFNHVWLFSWQQLESEDDELLEPLNS